MAKQITLEELFTGSLLSIPDKRYTIPVEQLVKGKRFLNAGGVYTFYNRFNEPLYVGISGNVGKRTNEHLQPKRGNKDLYRYLQGTTGNYVQVFYEGSAVYQEIYESYLIKQLNPRFNVAKTGRERIG